MQRRTITFVVAAVTALALLAPAGLASAKNGKSDNAPGQKAKAAVVAGPHAVTAKVSRGTTTLALALQLPASVSVRRPARAGSGTVAFPVTGGRITVMASGTTVSTVTAANIRHVGGLTLTKGSTAVTLKNLVIDGLDLTAQVKVATGSTTRLTIATLSQPSTITLQGRSLSATGITVTLTQAAASALNAVLGTTYSSATVLGTAALSTRVIGKPYR
jgi:redox-sensitive bicupin YhaK (pirin superfamily)